MLRVFLAALRHQMLCISKLRFWELHTSQSRIQGEQALWDALQALWFQHWACDAGRIPSRVGRAPFDWDTLCLAKQRVDMLL